MEKAVEAAEPQKKDSVLNDETVKVKLSHFQIKNVNVSFFVACYLFMAKGIDRIPSFVVKYRTADGKKMKKKNLGFMPKEKFIEFLNLD